MYEKNNGKSQIIIPKAVLNIEMLSSGKNFITGQNVNVNRNTYAPLNK